MTFRLLLLDVDGTTVESNGTALPSQRVRNAIDKAKGKVHIALATGRSLEFTQSVIDALELTGLSIFNGGAEIIDLGTGKLIESKKLSVEALRELVRLALPFGYTIYTDENQYAVALQNSDNIAGPAAKLFIEQVKSADAVHILEELNGVPDTKAHPTTSWGDGDVVDIHVTHQLATKRQGAEKLIKRLGFEKDQVIAVGDGYNDVPLLEAAGLRIAMGNAPDEVKKLADYVAPTLADDGVADVIERYILRS